MATYNDASLTYDDADYVYDGIAESQGIAVLVGSLSAAEDVTQYVKWDTLVATDGGTGAKGTVNLRLERAISALTTLTDQSLLRLLDLSAHDEPIRAIVTSRRPFVLPGYTATEVIAEHVSALLDSTFIASEIRSAETAQTRITALWGGYAGSPLDLDDLSKVANIGTTLPEQNFAGVTLRQAIESTISQASTSADYYVDSLGKLHVFTSEINDAPANIDADAPTPGYSLAVLALDPVAYWRLGEASGTVAVDEMGANNGTYVNAPTLGAAGLLTGDPNTAVTFDGTTQYATVPDAAALDYGDVFTLAVWARNSVAVTGNECLINKGLGTGSLYVTAGNVLTLDKGATARLVASTSSFSVNAPHFLVATKAGATVKLYIDGVDVTGVVTNATMIDTATQLAIGSEQSANSFNGTLDEPAIWNRALTAAEIANLHAIGTGEQVAAGGEIAPERLDIDYDSGSYANRVYIQGANPAGSGYYSDTAAITAVGMTRTAVLQAPDCETAAMATALANMYLGRVSSSTPRGSFTITDTDGWRSGQNLTVTSADHGLVAEAFRIARVTTRVARPGTLPVRSYSVEFGGSRAGGSGVSADSLGSGQLVSGQLGGASNLYVSSDGVSVTDGSTVRAHIGKLPNGSYGVRIVSSTGAVLIDGEQITITGSAGTISGSQLSGGTIPSGVALGISQTTVTAAGVKVATGGVDRVILGAIGGGDYGLKITNAGSVVLIDGSSNMFKIAASGSLSIALPAQPAGDFQTVVSIATLTGLGAQTTIPAHLSYVADSLTVTTNRRIGAQNVIGLGAVYVATGSGAAATWPIIGIYSQANWRTYLNASNQVVVALGGHTVWETAHNYYGVYHVLQEAAL